MLWSRICILFIHSLTRNHLSGYRKAVAAIQKTTTADTDYLSNSRNKSEILTGLSVTDVELLGYSQMIVAK
jgi:hypothetical protein